MNFAFFLHYLKEKYPCNENVSNSIQGAGLFPHRSAGKILRQGDGTI